MMFVVVTKHYNITFLQRAAMLAWQALYYVAITFPSVRLSGCPSVTRRYCVKTTVPSTVQIALSDSKICLVLYCKNQKKYYPGTTPSPLKSWFKLTCPLLIAARSDTFCLVAPQH